MVIPKGGHPVVLLVAAPVPTTIIDDDGGVVGVKVISSGARITTAISFHPDIGNQDAVDGSANSPHVTIHWRRVKTFVSYWRASDASITTRKWKIQLEADDSSLA